MTVRRLVLTIGLLLAFGAGIGVTFALSDPQADLLTSLEASRR